MRPYEVFESNCEEREAPVDHRGCSLFNPPYGRGIPRLSAHCTWGPLGGDAEVGASRGTLGVQYASSGPAVSAPSSP